LTAGVVSPFTADARIDQQKWSQLDRLYQRVVEISMRSSARSALKLRDNRVKREQNPRHGHYNGPIITSPSPRRGRKRARLHRALHDDHMAQQSITFHRI
jgi:hypothetical protein